MIYDVKIKAEEETLDLFPDAEYEVINNTTVDPFSFTPKKQFIHRWYVRGTKKAITDKLMLLKLKSGGDNIRITRITQKQLDIIKQRRAIWSFTDNDIGDLRALSGMTYVGQVYHEKERHTKEIFGNSVVETRLSEVLEHLDRNFAFNPFDASDPNFPETGYIVGFPKITAVEFDQRINMFRKAECGVCGAHFYRTENSFVVLEQLPESVQVEYKMRWDNPKAVFWFRNDSIDNLKKLAGI